MVVGVANIRTAPDALRPAVATLPPVGAPKQQCKEGTLFFYPSFSTQTRFVFLLVQAPCYHGDVYQEGGASSARILPSLRVEHEHNSLVPEGSGSENAVTQEFVQERDVPAAARAETKSRHDSCNWSMRSGA